MGWNAIHSEPSARSKPEAWAGSGATSRGLRNADWAFATALRSASRLIGFMRYWTAPSSTASWAVSMLGAPVIRMTGMSQP
jgi:hypothetical protein